MKEIKIGGRFPKHWIEQTVKETANSWETEGSITYKNKTFKFSYKGKKEEGTLYIGWEGKLLWIPLDDLSQKLWPKDGCLAHLIIYQNGELEVLGSVNRCDRCKSEQTDKKSLSCLSCDAEIKLTDEIHENRKKIMSILEKHGPAIAEVNKWRDLNMPEQAEKLLKNAPHIKEKMQEIEELKAKDIKLTQKLEKK